MSKIRGSIPKYLKILAESGAILEISSEGDVISKEELDQLPRWALRDLGRFNRRLLRRIIEPQEDLNIVSIAHPEYGKDLKDWVAMKLKVK